MLDWVATISPWWWLAFALGLGVVEMSTMSFFLIWPALAALIVAALVALVPGMSGAVIVTIFAVLSVALTFAGRSIMSRFGDGGGPDTGLNSRSQQLIGRRATVLDWDGGSGSVEVDGIRWKAIWDDASPASADGKVQITQADGMTLHVKNVAP